MNIFSEAASLSRGQETGKEAFQLRLWDGRIGRWLTTDPYGQYSSPYLGMGNNPISGVDPDGGYYDGWQAFWAWVGGGFKGDIEHPGLGGNKNYSIAWTERHDSGEILWTTHQKWGNISHDKLGVENGHVYANVLKGNKSYDSKFLGASTNYSFIEFNALFAPDLDGFTASADAAYFKQDVALRLGTDNINVNGSGNFEFLSADAKAGSYIYTGNNGKYGGSGTLEAGAHVVKAEATGGFSLLGVEVDYTVGVTGLAAHAGVHGAAYYDENTGQFVIEGFEHLGLGVGEKAGVNIKIPVSWIWE